MPPARSRENYCSRNELPRNGGRFTDGSPLVSQAKDKAVLSMIRRDEKSAGTHPTPCPPLCSEQHVPGASDVLHLCDSGEVWGATTARFGEPKVGAYLERLDDADGLGTPRIGLQASANGVAVNIDITMDLDVAAALIAELQRLVEMGHRWSP
jgi:hypothetical protein